MHTHPFAPATPGFRPFRLVCKARDLTARLDALKASLQGRVPGQDVDAAAPGYAPGLSRRLAAFACGDAVEVADLRHAGARRAGRVEEIDAGTGCLIIRLADNTRLDVNPRHHGGLLRRVPA